MNCYSYYVAVAYILKISNALDLLERWNYINLHCRDNEARPVDWWYIYKPPNELYPYLSPNNNYSYITPDAQGHWTPHKHLSGQFMLRHTLSPAYRSTNVDHIAVVKYDQRNANGDEGLDQGTSVFGLLMADTQGGVWITHTVPGFPDLNNERVPFPPDESPNGHMFVCLSLDLETLNKITAKLKQTVPNFVDIKIPRNFQGYVPEFNKLKQSTYQPPIGGKLTKYLDFKTKAETLRATMLIREPGEKHCLYKTFAKDKRIVLDIYGHKDHKKPICEKDFSIRNIDVISLKSPVEVRYINNKTDHTVFAVSTTAHWQRVGSGPGQFWVCVNNHYDDPGKGALMMCVDDYNVWKSFDNLKVKEPDC